MGALSPRGCRSRPVTSTVDGNFEYYVANARNGAARRPLKAPHTCSSRAILQNLLLKDKALQALDDKIVSQAGYHLFFTTELLPGGKITFTPKIVHANSEVHVKP